VWNVTGWFCTAGLGFAFVAEPPRPRPARGPRAPPLLLRAAAAAARASTLRSALPSGVAAAPSQDLPRAQSVLIHRPQCREKNRRDTGKSQSIWADSKMETPG
jgi:hypothetical protein